MRVLFPCEYAYTCKSISTKFNGRKSLNILQLFSSKTEHCAKNVQIRSFFWSVFSPIWAECGDLFRKSPYSVRQGKIRNRKFGHFSCSETNFEIYDFWLHRPINYTKRHNIFFVCLYLFLKILKSCSQVHYIVVIRRPFCLASPCKEIKRFFETLIGLLLAYEGSQYRVQVSPSKWRNE